jgi:putative membrane protein
MKATGILSMVVAATLAVACNTSPRTEVAENRDVNNDNRVGTTGAEGGGVGDNNFVEESTEAGMAEVELGKLAVQKGQSAEVKRFGQMMIDDHTRAGNELKQAAAQHNISPPAELEDDHRDLYERLSKLQGAEFDREYIQAMVDSHQKVVDHLESRVDTKTLGDWRAKWNATIDPDTEIPVAIMPEQSDNPATMAINQWAAKTLPAAERHLAHAKMLKDGADKGRSATH